MLNKLRDEIHENAKKHGWWEEERSFLEIIALCHSELSEALEEYREGHSANYICYKLKEDKLKPEGISVELADCIICILDYCGKMEIDIDKAIRIKHEYNKTQPYRHGNKVV